MVDFLINEIKSVNARFLVIEAGVRYWEDATVNGVSDDDGDLIPFRDGSVWRPTIDLDTGKVEHWPQGTTASIHYKVCDDGRYMLFDADRDQLAAIEGYVPEIMSPGGNGYGDYIIMDIDEGGVIANWRVTLDEFAGGAA